VLTTFQTGGAKIIWFLLCGYCLFIWRGKPKWKIEALTSVIGSKGEVKKKKKRKKINQSITS
jgi:hypothetical protein